jgi:hypothetical protein
MDTMKPIGNSVGREQLVQGGAYYSICLIQDSIFDMCSSRVLNLYSGRKEKHVEKVGRQSLVVRIAYIHTFIHL